MTTIDENRLQATVDHLTSLPKPSYCPKCGYRVVHANSCCGIAHASAAKPTADKPKRKDKP